MFIRDGKNSNVQHLIVGTGGVTKGDLCVVSSNTVVKAAASGSAATFIGIALETALEGALAAIDVAGGRVITAEYAGTASNLATCKVYDLTDANTVNIDDVGGGCCFCVGYNTDKTRLDFILTEASRII